MCRQCFAWLNGISVGTLKSIIKSFDKKTKVIERKEGSGRPQSDKSITAEYWFKELIASVGEYSPESPVIHLPPAHRQDYFQEYLDDHIEQETMSNSAFFKMWRKKFPKVKVPINQRLGKCPHCVLLREELDATRDPKVISYFVLFL